MTGTGGPAGPGDPPELSLELLADLHADALTQRVAARLRPQVMADPQAHATLAALDATVADLAALPTRCPARMPDAVAQRLETTLAALAIESPAGGRRAIDSTAVGPPAVESQRVESQRVESQRVDRHPPARTAHRRATPVIMTAWRRRRARWIGAGVLAAAVAGVTMIGVTTGGTPRAGDALGAAAVAPPVPLALSGGDLGGALDHVLGARDYGPLSRPEALRRCLDANDVPASDKPLGARQVTLDGRPGVILALPTTRIDRFHLLVVGPDCAPGNPARIADSVADG